MLDPELKEYLQKIDAHLQNIHQKTESVWHGFTRGALHGLGSVIGVALALVIIGWILNVVGIIPAFKEQTQIWQQNWNQTLEEVKRLR